jgi:hypothetical protein
MTACRHPARVRSFVGKRSPCPRGSIVGQERLGSGWPTLGVRGR